MKKILGLLTTLILTASAAPAELTVGEAAPDFALTDITGKTVNLSDYKGKHVVLEWTNHGCPFVKKFYRNGDMQALQEKYRAKNVVWLSICSSAPGKQGHYSADEWPEVNKEKGGNATAVLIDEDGTVGRTYGARTTPHMYVVDPNGFLIYQGAIDSIRSTDSGDIAEAVNFVDLCLKASLNGEAVDTPVTRPYGCSVKY